LLVSSWVATILTPQFSSADVSHYVEATSAFRSQRSVSNPDGLSSIWTLANKLVNEGTAANVATVSKLLHFDMPLVFPMLDRRVARKLGLSVPPSFNDYKDYIECLISLQANYPTLWNSIVVNAGAASVPPLRIIDAILF